MGRIVGFDVGERRIGVAVSDASCTLARPAATLTVHGISAAVDAAAEQVARLMTEDDGVSMLVVGWPRRLDGSPNAMTPHAERFARELAARTNLAVALQDERLSSHEADSRLAVRTKDWRARKKLLDSAAAAVILQDYLDARPAAPAAVLPEP